MSINLDALLELSKPKRKVEPCLVGQIVKELPEPYKGALITLLETEEVPTTRVTERMNAAGLRIANTTVYKHRKNVCTCKYAGGAA